MIRNLGAHMQGTIFCLIHSLVAASLVMFLTPSSSVYSNDICFTCCSFSFVGLWLVQCLKSCLICDSAIWAQTAATDRATTTGGLFLQPCSIEQHQPQKRGSGPQSRSSLSEAQRQLRVPDQWRFPRYAMDWLHLLLQLCSELRIHWFEPKEVRV